MIVKLLTFVAVLCVAEGFRCLTCSYGGSDVEFQHSQCLEYPEELDRKQSIKCGNFCVTQEQFDKRSSMIKSFIRTCSVDWGNRCKEDDFSIICTTSCIGDFCNIGLKRDPTTNVRPTVCPLYEGCAPFTSSAQSISAIATIGVKICNIPMLVMGALWWTYL